MVEPLPDFFHQLSETYRSFEGLILENVAIRTRAEEAPPLALDVLRWH